MIHSGKAQLVRIADNASMTDAVDLGYCKKCLLAWEKQVSDLMPANLQVGGDGKVDIETAETGDTMEAELMAFHGTTAYVEATDRSGYTLVAGPFMGIINLARNFKDPKNPHVYKIAGKKYTDAPSDFFTGPTAPV